MVHRWQPSQSSPNSVARVNNSDSPTKINSIAANFVANRHLTLRPNGPLTKILMSIKLHVFLDINEINKNKIWSRRQNQTNKTGVELS